MARRLNRLTAVEVKGIDQKGMHHDGGGLYLQVSAAGTKSWIYRFTLDGRAREMGLGPLNAISLAEARKRAGECRRMRHDGIDPIEARGAQRDQKRLEGARSMTFLITHYPQPSRLGTKQEHTAVSAGLNDGAQHGAISKGAQRGPVCCSLRNRGSVPGGGDALALAIRLCLSGLRRAASQRRQDPGALPVYRLSTADIRDRRNDFRQPRCRCALGFAPCTTSLRARAASPALSWAAGLASPRPPPGRSSTSSCRR